MKKCEACDGSGRDPNASDINGKPCKKCKGTGKTDTTGTYLLYFPLPNGDKKTKVFDVRNKTQHLHLGHIRFRPQWRKYVFEPAHINVVFDATCLEALAQFLHGETQAWRAMHTRKKKVS